MTLTYNDINLPLANEIPTLHKPDVQRFMKRLRNYVKKNYPENKTIKYYLCGEYGGQTERPHYHAIIFNIPNAHLQRPELIQTIWGLGNIRFDPCTPASISYVTGYIMKKSSEDVLKLFENTYDINSKQYVQKLRITRIDPKQEREREFSLMSKKMGLSHLTPQTIEYYKNNLDGITLKPGGEKQGIPRYFKEKIFTDQEKKKVKQNIENYIESQDEIPEHKIITVTQDIFRKAERKVRETRLKL